MSKLEEIPLFPGEDLGAGSATTEADGGGGPTNTLPPLRLAAAKRRPMGLSLRPPLEHLRHRRRLPRLHTPVGLYRLPCMPGVVGPR